MPMKTMDSVLGTTRQNSLEEEEMAVQLPDLSQYGRYQLLAIAVPSSVRRRPTF